jgi:hypothetical protein
MVSAQGETCAWCEAKRHIKQGRIWLCVKHYRFQGMRTSATRADKYAPPYSHLELEFSKCGLICPHCNRYMNWLKKDGDSTVITLQHDRKGTWRFLCGACNTRHSRRDGDSFYSIPINSKMCPRCGTVKLLAEFTSSKRGWAGRNTYCHSCAARYAVTWRLANKIRRRQLIRRNQR